MIATWYVEAGKYDVMPVDGSGLARMIAEKTADRRAARPVRLLPGHAVGPVLRRAAGAQPPAQHHRRRRDPRRRRRGRAALPGHRRRRLLVLRQGRHSCTTSTTTSGASLLRRVVTRPAAQPARHELRFEFEPTGQPDLATGKGAPGRLQLYVDGELVGDAEAPRTRRRSCSTPAALTCGANPGSPVTPDYAGPFRFTGTIHTVTVDVSGELIHDPEAELRCPHGPPIARRRRPRRYDRED